MSNGLRWIEENRQSLVALSQVLWEFAEPGLKEERSSTALADRLEREGFSVRMGVAGMPTAFVASYGEAGPTIGYVGEYDAIPSVSQKKGVASRDPLVEGGAGHGCGHNLLGVATLAAAIALKRDIEAGLVKGSVRYYGCPAEELLVGKVFMAKHGLFDDLDAAITWHPLWVNSAQWLSQPGLNSARFIFRGVAAHASSAPHAGISALDAVELMNVGANYLREHVLQEARIHYIITNGGAEPNVVPPLAEVWYYVRAPHRQEVDEIYGRLVKIAQGAALMTGAELEIKFLTGVHDYLPNAVITGVLEESLRRLGPPQFSDEDRALARSIADTFAPGQKEAILRASKIPSDYWEPLINEDITPAFGKGDLMPPSTDFADVSWITPAGQVFLTTWANGTAIHSWQATAQTGMGIAEKGMLKAAQVMALSGYELLANPELLRKAREAHSRDVKGQPYVSPLPPELMAPEL